MLWMIINCCQQHMQHLTSVCEVVQVRISAVCLSSAVSAVIRMHDCTCWCSVWWPLVSRMSCHMQWLVPVRMCYATLYTAWVKKTRQFNSCISWLRKAMHISNFSVFFSGIRPLHWVSPHSNIFCTSCNEMIPHENNDIKWRRLIIVRISLRIQNQHRLRIFFTRVRILHFPVPVFFMLGLSPFHYVLTSSPGDRHLGSFDEIVLLYCFLHWEIKWIDYLAASFPAQLTPYGTAGKRPSDVNHQLALHPASSGVTTP